jgi:hypothetical protein
MASLGNLLGRFREPTARIDEAKFITFFGLDIAELGIAGLLTIVPTLLLLGLQADLLIKIPLIAAWPLLTFTLFGIRRERRSVFDWMGVLVPYSLRRKRFSRGTSVRETPAEEALDAHLRVGTNLVSWTYRRGDDGEPELHVYEEPARPYRAWKGFGHEAFRPGAFTTAAGRALHPSRWTRPTLPGGKR